MNIFNRNDVLHALSNKIQHIVTKLAYTITQLVLIYRIHVVYCTIFCTVYFIYIQCFLLYHNMNIFNRNDVLHALSNKIQHIVTKIAYTVIRLVHYVLIYRIHMVYCTIFCTVYFIYIQCFLLYHNMNIFNRNDVLHALSNKIQHIVTKIAYTVIRLVHYVLIYRIHMVYCTIFCTVYFIYIQCFLLYHNMNIFNRNDVLHALSNKIQHIVTKIAYTVIRLVHYVLIYRIHMVYCTIFCTVYFIYIQCFLLYHNMNIFNRNNMPYITGHI